MTRRFDRRLVWHARPADRILFQHRIAACGAFVRRVRAPHRHRGGFALAVRLNVPDLPAQTIVIAFGRAAPDVPHVYTDGPDESPHRYLDNALCMWHPHDPAESRWVRADGPVALLGHIVAHLLREEWWRHTGEWAGAEAAHPSDRSTDATVR
ncbi:hypothetical protein [Actinomadura welshii]|uniref:hypothetical protein n=1 Tax=Actinomadura welshii TaxID=3103817 RepID=UPI00046536EE|nr:hypothetical protein [Actinomadura madurae]